MEKTDNSMCEKFLSLPLFHGLNRRDFFDVISTLKLDFRKYRVGDFIAMQGDVCDSLICVIDGDINVEYRDENIAFILTEKMVEMPSLIELHNLFGVRHTYERSYISMAESRALIIDKHVFLFRLMEQPIVRNNLINLLCNQLRKSNDERGYKAPCSIDEKLRNCLLSYCSICGGEKIIRTRMCDLASMIGVSKMKVSNILHKWQQDSLVEMTRNSFIIKDLK